MRGFISYVLAGLLVVLAMDFVASPAGLGASLASTVAGQNSTIQSVDRTNKGDRIQASSKIGKQQQAPPRRVLVGCDPVFSPLSASAQANRPGRCLA